MLDIEFKIRISGVQQDETSIKSLMKGGQSVPPPDDKQKLPRERGGKPTGSSENPGSQEEKTKGPYIKHPG